MWLMLQAFLISALDRGVQFRAEATLLQFGQEALCVVVKTLFFDEIPAYSQSVH